MAAEKSYYADAFYRYPELFTRRDAVIRKMRGDREFGGNSHQV